MAETIEELLIEVGASRVRAAAIVDDRLDDFFARPRRRQGAIGSIYLGRVVRRAPGLGAAFVELGVERPALLELGKQEEVQEGAAVMAQIIEEAAGDKAARASRRISIPGRTIVLLPGGKGASVSRRIGDAKLRERLRATLQTLLAPGEGAIVRSDAAKAAQKTLADELVDLRRGWAEIEARAASMTPPACLHDTGDGLIEAFEAFAASDPRRIVVDDRAAARALTTYAKLRWPQLAGRIDAGDPGEAVFARHDVADLLAELEDKEVALPSGGRLVIETTEALSVIDVDTQGSAARPRAAYSANLEAAREAGRQIRLRDLAGIVVIDFIRMVERAERENVLNALRLALTADRRPVEVLGWTRAGLAEIVRTRSRRELGEG